MAEVDSKFAKFADKECDNVSGEVKKWFKKLAVGALVCLPDKGAERAYRKRSGRMTRRSRLQIRR